jgi:hypothetical protein
MLKKLILHLKRLGVKEITIDNRNDPCETNRVLCEKGAEFEGIKGGADVNSGQSLFQLILLKS